MNLTDDMTMEGLSYTDLMLIWNYDVDCAMICVRIILLMLTVYLSLLCMKFGQTAVVVLKN